MTKLSLFIGLLATVSNYTTTTVTTQTLPEHYQAIMTQEELKFVELVNHERVKHGLSQLSLDEELIEIARRHSHEMSEQRYFSHTSPTPGLHSPMDRYLAGIDERPAWALIGENLFYCSIVDVDRGHVALMNSKTHRDNILEQRFERIGVGAYTNSDGEFYVTQVFLARID